MLAALFFVEVPLLGAPNNERRAHCDAKRRKAAHSRAIR
jgi:hypothetical protein